MIGACLTQHYGLAAREVRRLPGGYHASAYLVDDACVAKLYSAPPALDLLVTLHARGLPVVAPQPSLSGALWCACGDRFLALFPVVRGQTPADWPNWDPAVLRSLGALLRRVHAVSVDGLPIDDLAVAFDDSLLSSPLVPYRDELAEQLDRLRTLGLRARASQWEPVLCHTDAAGDNIMVTPSGGLILLD